MRAKKCDHVIYTLSDVHLLHHCHLHFFHLHYCFGFVSVLYLNIEMIMHFLLTVILR